MASSVRIKYRMAWNYNSYERVFPNLNFDFQIPKWAYNKNSKVDRILDDLQVYRIATGQINSKDYAAVLEKNGWDVTKLSHMVYIMLILDDSIDG